jgi:hypothetical protein
MLIELKITLLLCGAHSFIEHSNSTLGTSCILHMDILEGSHGGAEHCTWKFIHNLWWLVIHRCDCGQSDLSYQLHFMEFMRKKCVNSYDKALF